MKKILLLTIMAVFLNSCVELRIDGCTDPCAANFDPLADDNDGSCLYAAGCTDPYALNYDPCAVAEYDDACYYTCDVVYYLDYSAAQYMLNWGISYYSFYDYNFDYLGSITPDYYWNSPPDCTPQVDGSTLTATLYWYGNYDDYMAIFSWSAYANSSPIPDYEGTFIVSPNECITVGLTKKKIQEYKEASK